METGTKAAGERASSQSRLSPSTPLPAGQGAAGHSTDPTSISMGLQRGKD